MEDVPDLDGAQKLNKNELKLATTLVQEMVTSLSEIDTVDNYHEALKNLIESQMRKITIESIQKAVRRFTVTAVAPPLNSSSVVR